MCDFNIPGVDHKFPLPALPGKWPGHHRPCQGSLQSLSRKSGSNGSGESSGGAASAERRPIAPGPPRPPPALPGRQGPQRRGRGNPDWTQEAQALPEGPLSTHAPFMPGLRPCPHTSFHQPVSPPGYLGTEKEERRPRWYFFPSSQPSRAPIIC